MDHTPSLYIIQRYAAILCVREKKTFKFFNIYHFICVNRVDGRGFKPGYQHVSVEATSFAFHDMQRGSCEVWRMKIVG